MSSTRNRTFTMLALLLVLLTWPDLQAQVQTATPTSTPTATPTATPTSTPIPGVSTPIPSGPSSDTFGNVLIRGFLKVRSGLQLGTDGSMLASTYYQSYTIDTASVTNATCLDSPTLSLPGATVGNQCALGMPAAPTANLMFMCFVQASGVAKIRTCNLSAAPVDPASATYSIRVFAP